jgi:hypothetical protein
MKKFIIPLIFVVSIATLQPAYAKYSFTDRLDDNFRDIIQHSEPSKYRTKTIWETVPVMSAMGLIVSDVLGNTVGQILKPLEDLAGISIKLDGEYGQIKEMKKTYEDNYKKDHADLDQKNRISVDWNFSDLRSGLESAGAISFAGTSNNARKMLNEQDPGYRMVSGGSVNNYADLFRSRADRWQDIAFGILAANNSEARGVASAQSDIKSMNETSNGASGYIQIIQAGSQERNYLNRNLVQARADVMRQIDVQFKYSLEKIQDDSDAASAFEQAVRSWTAQGSAGNY